MEGSIEARCSPSARARYGGSRDWLCIASLLLMGLLALGFVARAVQVATGGRGGVPLDDTWIHLQFARNLAHGHGLAFNPGQPTAGSTAPLWTVLLAGLAGLGAPFPIAAQLLSAACFLGVLAVTYWLGLHLTPNRFLAWLGAATIAWNGRLVWAAVSGLETCLFTALSGVALGLALQDRRSRRMRARTGAAFGLAALCRPEGYLLFALALADFVAAAVVRRGAGRRFHWKRLPVAPALVFGLFVLPYLAFALRTSGHLLPNAYHAKAVVSPRPDTDVLSMAAQYLILDTTVTLPLCLLGAVFLLETVPILPLWSLVLPLAYAFMHVPLYQHGRYLMPLIPFQGLCLAAGLHGLPRLFPRLRLGGMLARAGWIAGLALASLLASGWRLPVMARLTAANVDNVNQMHVALGKWAAQHTPPDALLAVNDIGAIAYFSQRPVLDLAGLVSPEVVPILHRPDRDDRLADLLIERGAEYAIIFPNWFPGLAGRRDLLQPIYQVTLEHNTIAGGDTMVVYQVHSPR